MGRVTEYIAFMNDKEKRKGKGMGKLKQSDLNNFKHFNLVILDTKLDIIYFLFFCNREIHTGSFCWYFYYSFFSNMVVW